MAIDHESPFKELRLKNRRIMGGGGPEPEEEAPATAHGEEEWPRWLGPLLSSRFFAHCVTHADSHRSGECNMFCLDCSAADGVGALCSLCLAHAHRGHHTIQIRRSSYHDVIRVSDIQRFLDIAGVQTYVINSARVIFLNERPQQHKPGAGGKAASASANLCEVCARSLLDNFRFCSLGCKVVGCSPDPVKARNRLRYPSSSDGAASSSLRNAADKMQQSFTPPTPPTLPTKRRKGIPHRAPFGSLIVEY
ncbi:hypothetical protein EJB05_23259 [Eragrostis curvula]|uniref:B box-type domain-containing protein n=1 Tax=Eragrostis curvula TaxID=38414 RepID=A0A5J9V622_9POAL|nr:hypothetical protein EJB05_23259 [Eragrostis curvula]